MGAARCRKQAYATQVSLNGSGNRQNFKYCSQVVPGVYLVKAVATEALVIKRHHSPADEDVWFEAHLEAHRVGRGRLEPCVILCRLVS